jgi:Putative DNA-binding domain
MERLNESVEIETAMKLDQLPFDEINESHLQMLVEGRAPEGLRLEFKRDGYGRSDADKKELLKDVSGFANSAGGDLLIGIDESDGCASAVTGLDPIGMPDELLRMDNIIRSSLTPTISGLKIRSVSLANGRTVCALRVPASWSKPHRVTYQGSNKFFVRNANSVNEASLTELRAMFTGGTTARERASRFRDDRLSEIDVAQLNIPSEYRGVLVLHIVPASIGSEYAPIDLHIAHAQQESLRPIDPANYGFSPNFNADGFINDSNSFSGRTYTQIFRDGCVEAIVSGIASRRDRYEFIEAGRIERAILEYSTGFFAALEQLSLSPPFFCFATLLDCRSAVYKVTEYWADAGQARISRDTWKISPSIVLDYSSMKEYRLRWRPTIDALWNSAGRGKADWYKEDGTWQRPRWAG